jgi:hypothetical protein
LPRRILPLKKEALWVLLPLAWLLQGAVTALIAERRGVGFFDYYWRALLLPLITLAFVIWAPAESLVVRRRLEVLPPNGPPCPKCGENLPIGAISCDLCGCVLATAAPRTLRRARS